MGLYAYNDKCQCPVFESACNSLNLKMRGNDERKLSFDVRESYLTWSDP